MESFFFKAATPQGKVVEGERSGASRAHIIDALHADGLVPIRIDPSTGGRRLGDFVRLHFGASHISQDAILLLCKELATLLGAGIAADRAIAIVARTAPAKAVQQALASAREALRAGTPLSAALREALPRLPGDALSLIEAGEATGRLAAAFDSLSKTLEARLALRRSLISALIYPAILLATSLCAILFLLTYVLPQFKSVFADAGARLPLPTLVLIWVGEAIERYGLYAALALAAALIAGLNWRTTAEGRSRLDASMLRLPIFGKLLVRHEVARTARTLSSLLASKVPLAKALALAGEGIANVRIKDGFKAAALRAREGERLGRALMASGYWPPDAVELVTIGEEAGRLDLMLANLAELYETDLKRRAERFLTLLTPALTLIMGGIVAAIMGAVISAILGAYDLPG